MFAAFTVGYQWPRPEPDGYTPTLVDVEESPIPVDTTSLYLRDPLWIVTWIDTTGVMREKMLTTAGKDVLLRWIASRGLPNRE